MKLSEVKKVIPQNTPALPPLKKMPS